MADLTGRDEIAAELGERLRAGGNGGGTVLVVAISGPAGVGKTTLAVHVAHAVSGAFPDGQLYVDLRGGWEAHRAEPGEVLARFLRGLGVAGAQIPRAVAERAEEYRSRLAGRRLLVVLDNAADEAQIRPLIPGTPGCAVLVTSRAKLAGLPGARLAELDVLEPGRAVELLGRIAGPSGSRPSRGRRARSSGCAAACPSRCASREPGWSCAPVPRSPSWPAAWRTRTAAWTSWPTATWRSAAASATATTGSAPARNGCCACWPACTRRTSPPGRAPPCSTPASPRPVT
ncbi:NB-ARC domain-containing protein [Nonomuraea thailandensis]